MMGTTQDGVLFARNVWQQMWVAIAKSGGRDKQMINDDLLLLQQPTSNNDVKAAFMESNWDIDLVQIELIYIYIYIYKIVLTIVKI